MTETAIAPAKKSTATAAAKSSVLPAPAVVAQADLPETFAFGPQQGTALRRVSHWFKHESRTQQVFRLFGFAGTGKTTLAKHLAAEIGGQVCFAAFTGKASLMLRSCGCEDASTIHSAMYKTRTAPDGSVRFILNRNGVAAKAKLIVIDECSMVDEEIGQDLLSFGVPILVLGDPAQLPPVKSAGFFTEVDAPDVMLTEIHRQAKDNPIIRLATAVREGRPLPYGTFGTVEIGRRGERGPSDVVSADQIIVGRNATREAYNKALRTHLGRKSPYPEVGDKLVCLRNDNDLGIFNGGLFEVERMLRATRGKKIPMSIRSEDEETGTLTVNVLPQCFDGDISKVEWRRRREAQEFTYGYALTCHKAQGSQWDHVVAYDESDAFGAAASRWLYTAVTRASERLTLIR